MGSSINRDELGPSADNGVPARSLPPTKTLAEALSTKNSIAADGATPTVDAVGPIRIGRYQILRVLGDGGFGRVFLAYDEELCRQVAVKVPHAYRVQRPEDVARYLVEARILAQLDHPAIVPVFDCGRSEDGRCFIVSKYIEGTDLATKIKRAPLTFAASAELAAQVAQAVHVAHLKGIVHRDIKPANILLDLHDRPYLADFGVALREEDYGNADSIIGTLPYMSPEQIRGEGHLVDGRSDIFSLGVVLYELLTGRRPFPENRFSHGVALEPRPPRQVADAIPKELERICLKALSHRVAERYNTALDLATDLNDFLKAADHAGAPSPLFRASGSGATSGHLAAGTEITIIPKGLRSFDRGDAGFFLELLPGPRDRDGLPESVRFWKTRIEESDLDSTFRVGLLYGPSGCGKSSFLKAGVIPRLDPGIACLYVESTPLDTETRLLKALRKYDPHLPSDLDLPETMAALRRGGRVPDERKILIVLDQFEQWLHARPDFERSDLLRALRQCDGKRLQCILAVRDDFWMAVTHFAAELEIGLVPGDNVAALDLFSIQHARKVLSAIGRAYGTLPPDHAEIAAEQRSFIRKAVEELARNDRVAPVRLALFAEMVKDKPWTAATLKELGGIQGIGVTFLEEAFNGRTANPSHRLHQTAARAVLGALVSHQGGNLKGAMRPYGELLAVSGYETHPRDFDALLHVLDSELRLITPTDPAGLEAQENPSPGDSPSAGRYYHLTHDYLVPSLQEWLAWKQKETRRGRAELLLADRVDLWNANPRSRSLPSLLEWLNILLFTSRRARSVNKDSQKLLRAARAFYGKRMLVALAVFGALAWGADYALDRRRARDLVDSLETARTQDVPAIVAQIESVRGLANAPLRGLLASSDSSAPGHLHAAMALLPVDRGQESAVYDRLLIASPRDLPAIRDALANSGDARALTERLWKELLSPENRAEQRFRAGAALVALDPPSKTDSFGRWAQSSSFLAEQLIAEVTSSVTDVGPWIELIKPAGPVLVGSLNRIFSQQDRAQIDRHAAALVLGELVADQPRELTELVLIAEPDQYAVLLPKLLAPSLRTAAQAALTEEFNHPIDTRGPLAERLNQEKRRANASVTLLEFDLTEPLRSVLTSASDPDECSYAEERVGAVAAQPNLLVHMLESADTPLRAALVRSLGGIPPEKLPETLREPLIATVTRLFQSDPDPGVHSAAEWALRSWGRQELIVRLTKEMASAGPVDGRDWYVTPTGHTLVVFKGPITMQTGSPKEEPGRDASDEPISTRQINRDFALSTTEVTMEQFLAYFPQFPHKSKTDYVPTRDCAANMMTWHRACQYCLWLSQKEGIPEDQWCYTIVRKDAIPRDGYLSLTGYRLPTEVEWEYACRAGTSTPYSWGHDPVTSRRYAWTLANAGGRIWPVGRLCPNRFGLFDMHGNVSEWTSNFYLYSPGDIPKLQSGDDREDPQLAGQSSEEKADLQRVVRGGSANQFVPYQRSANRTPAKARSGVGTHSGFRIARTIKSHATRRN